MNGPSRSEVLLVGQRAAHNESLGLGYLLAALRQAGVRSRVARIETPADLVAIGEQARREQPLVVGMALPDGTASVLPLALGELLRSRGYRGHITAGGPFATLARHWLLDRYGWLDSVIRFAGERPLTELALALRRGCAEPACPGITTRRGDGPAAPLLDSAPFELVPEHEELPEIFGQRVAQLYATRGCPGSCTYCAPAALQRLARAEGSTAWAEYPGRLWPTSEGDIKFQKEPLPKCSSPAVLLGAASKVKLLAAQLASCHSIDVGVDDFRGRVLVMPLDIDVTSAGHEQWLGRDRLAPGPPPLELQQLVKAIAAGLSREELGCIVKEVGLRVDGGRATEGQATANQAAARCGAVRKGAEGSNIFVTIDDQGSVAAVTTGPSHPASPAALACIRSALKGLRFPCHRHDQVDLQYIGDQRTRPPGAGDFF
jgi:hypothetical protein